MDIRILWADDEIELLKPQILFLENRNIRVSTVTNGHDLLDIYEKDSQFDVIFLDESMPGLSGIETLERLKKINPRVPVVMITKNEEEDIMEEAIGSNIADYLIKPVNPNQILMALKKIVQNKDLVSAKTSMDYQQEFRNLFMKIQESNSYDEWAKIYRELVNWELKIDESEADEMKEIFSTQKTEANVEFSKFILRRYQNWMKGEDRPLMSPDLMRNQVFPELKDNEPIIFLLLDNLRYDQWKVIEPIIAEYYSIEKEDYHYSILPTSTQYSRNAIFSGLMPVEIQKRFPDWWIFDHEKGGKNQFEKDLLGKQIEKLVRKPLKWDYVKVTSSKSGRELGENMFNYLNNDLTVLVYNFIDMFSHARTEMEVLKELAKDETAYRSITKSWFLHSPLWAGLKKIAKEKVKLIITTDHGTIRVKQPTKVIGDKETTTNLRYKLGKNLNFNKKDVLAERTPENIGLPKSNLSSAYIFATEDKYFLYPNNYNYYNSYYKDSFQHGGISLEEMICPFVSLRSRAE